MTGEDFLSLAVIYLVLCGIVALIAPMRGREPVSTFGFCLLFSPLLGFLWVVLSNPSAPTD